MTNAAFMRNKITLQRRSMTQSTDGSQALSWSDLGVVWAQIEALTGREVMNSQSIHASDTHKITIRFFPGLTAKDRLLYSDSVGTVHVYNLTDVNDSEMRHRFMICTGIEGTSLG